MYFQKYYRRQPNATSDGGRQGKAAARGGPSVQWAESPRSKTTCMICTTKMKTDRIGTDTDSNISNNYICVFSNFHLLGWISNFHLLGWKRIEFARIRIRISQISIFFSLGTLNVFSRFHKKTNVRIEY